MTLIIKTVMMIDQGAKSRAGLGEPINCAVAHLLIRPMMMIFKI